MPKQKKYLECPIFSVIITLIYHQLLCLKDCIVVSVGGGGKRVGLKNSLQLFPLPKQGLVLKDPFFTLELGDDIVERLRYCTIKNLIVGNSEDKCVIYLFEDNQIIEVAQFKTDFAKKEPYQNDAVLNKNGSVLATGGDDGQVRLWSMDQDYKVEQVHEFDALEQSKVVSLDFHNLQPLLLAAVDNSQVKFINYESKEVIQVLVLEKNPLKLKFFTANFFGDHNQFFTITNQMRGASYLTFWMMRADNSILPMVTHKANDHPITASCLTSSGALLGIGGADGSTSIYNIISGEFQCKAIAHEMIVKGLGFTASNRFLLSGSPDFTYEFQPNEKPTGWFTTLTLFYIVVMVLIGLVKLMLSIME